MANGGKKRNCCKLLTCCLKPHRRQEDEVDKTTRDTSKGQYSKLDLFLIYVYSVVKINYTQKEQDDIQNSVEALVFFILKKVSVLKPTLQSNTLIRTGSAYDGSKIDALNEFDYLAVVDSLSDDNSVGVSGCATHPGFVHCKLQNPIIESDNISDNGLLKSVDSNGSMLSFRDLFRKFCHQVVENHSQTLEIKSDSGTLTLIGYTLSINGPQCELIAAWLPHGSESECINISIDVCPAIRCINVTDVIHEKDPVSKEIYDLIVKSGTYTMIPRPNKSCNFCFKLVLSGIDQKLVQELHDNHKQSLVVLKYLGQHIVSNHFCLKTVFSSFALKNALLHHSVHCEHAELGKCTIDVLTYMTECLRRKQPFLPSVFIQRRNIWKGLDMSTRKDNSMIISMAIDILDNLISFLKGLNKEDTDKSDCETILKRLKQTCKFQVQYKHLNNNLCPSGGPIF